MSLLKTWSDLLCDSNLRTFTDKHNHFWLEQNAEKTSKWAKLAREGHEIAWEFDSLGSSYTGRMLMNGEILRLMSDKETYEGWQKEICPPRGTARFLVGSKHRSNVRHISLG